MCNFSHFAEQAVDALVGQQLALTTAQHDIWAMGAFYVPGSNVRECTVCLKTGTTVLLSNIPEQMQQLHDLPAELEVTFEQNSQAGRDDYFVFQRGRQKMRLRKFANQNITFTVLTIPGVDIAEATETPLTRIESGDGLATAEIDIAGGSLAHDLAPDEELVMA